MAEPVGPAKRAAVVVLLVGSAVRAEALTPIRAENGDATSVLCFRGSPLPKCRGMLLAELSLAHVFTHAPEGTKFHGHRTVGDVSLGYLRNVDERNAFGGTVFVESGGSALGAVEIRSGVRARYRRWLGSFLSLDVAPGIAAGGSLSFPGFSGDISLGMGDLISPFLRVEYLRSTAVASRRALPPGQAPPTPEASHRSLVSAGVRFGSYASATVAGALLTGLLVLVALAPEGGN